jgi:hypothetical protein
MDRYNGTNSLRIISAAISCVVIDEILNADSLTTSKHWVHFLNIFLFLAGPEGSGRKNFRKETQCVSDTNEIQVELF